VKRLFSVKDVEGTVHYFEGKTDAKECRNNNPGSHVAKGPDHDAFGVKGKPRTHSHDSRSGGSGDGFRKSNGAKSAAKRAKARAKRKAV
jgi:hypothetical protein